MGRKPHPLISEFFRRGKKLGDTSNRYEQTCRCCDERVCFFPELALNLPPEIVLLMPMLTYMRSQFAKGRFEALLTHLVRNCPAIAAEDRAKCLPLYRPHQQQVPIDPSFETEPQPPVSGLSALETLAEVSRHHLDYSAQYPARKRRKVTAGQDGGYDEIEELPGAIPDGYMAVDAMVGTESGQNDDASHFFLADGGMERDETEQGRIQSAENRHAAAQVPPSLQYAASAASELMVPHKIATGPFQGYDPNENPEMLFTKFRTKLPNDPSPAIDPQLRECDEEIEIETVQDAFSPAMGMRPLAVKAPTSASGLNFSSARTKPRARGRFDEIRRKEVQSLRTLGACLRCRMLKKSCSNETPCAQCRKIDTARVWSTDCIRTKIADEFTLYNSGLFVVRAYHCNQRMKEHCIFEPSAGRIEARPFADLQLFVTFDSLVGQRRAATNHGAEAQSAETVRAIAVQTDNVSGKMVQYIRRVISDGYEVKCSPYIRTALDYGRKISSQSSNELMFRAMELEICTELLCREVPLQIVHNAQEESTEQPLSDAGPNAAKQEQISPNDHPQSYELISLQLQSAVERRASSLSKSVMHDLERRLVSRQQAPTFETFLVSLILLSCVQRMCTLYKTLASQLPERSVEDFPGASPSSPPGQLDESQTTDQALRELEEHLWVAAGRPQMQSPNKSFGQGQAEEGNAALEDVCLISDAEESLRSGGHAASSPSLPVPHSISTATSLTVGFWPLDKPPSFFYHQGESFSNILIMLLKIRNIIPVTTVRPEDGVIVVDDRVESQPIVPSPGAREWFENMALTEAELSRMVRERDEGMYLAKLLGKGWV